MNRRLLVSFLVASLVSLCSLVQTVHAGGAPFTRLSFPFATGNTCGSWLANGGGGVADEHNPFVYVVTDGNGIVVSSGQFVGQLDSGIFRSFAVQPTKNPLHFVATSTYLSDSGTDGDLYANDPCLPGATPVQMQPTCPGDLSSRLIAAGQGYVLPGLPNARRDKPGLTRDGSTVVGWISVGTNFKVLAGPVCVSNYAWWYVTYGNQFGWTPEGTGTEYWLAPIN